MSETVDLKKKSKELEVVHIYDDPDSAINFLSFVMGKEKGWEAIIHDPQTKPEEGPGRIPRIQSTLEKAGYATTLRRGEDVHELRVRNIGTQESFQTSIRELGLVKGIGHAISMLPGKLTRFLGDFKKIYTMLQENPQRGIGFWYLGGDFAYVMTGGAEKPVSEKISQELEGKTWLQKKMIEVREVFKDPIAIRKSFSGNCFTVMSVILLMFGKEGREAVMDDLLAGYNKALADGQDLGTINWEEMTKPSSPLRGFMEKNSMTMAASLMVLGKVATIDSAFFRLNNELRKMDASDGVSGEIVDSKGQLVDGSGDKLKLHRSGIGEGKGDWKKAWAKYWELDEELKAHPEALKEALKIDKELKKAGATAVVRLAEDGRSQEVLRLTGEQQRLLDKYEAQRALQGTVLEIAGPTASMFGWGMTAMGMGGRLANTLVTASSVLSLVGGGAISNPMQIIGESVYLMGDAFLWITGERAFGTEVAKATAAYLRVQAPYVLSPEGEGEVIRHTARRYAEEELKTESKDKNFTPSVEQIHEKAAEFEKLIRNELMHTPSRFDRVVTQAAFIVSQFPEADGMRDKALSNMLEFIKGASVTVKAEEGIFAKAIMEKVAGMQGPEANSGRMGSKYITVKDLAGDAAALMDAIPGSKYAANVLKLHELLIDAGARPVENGASRIVETHRKQVMDEVKSQSTTVHVAPQAQTVGVTA